MDETNHVNPLDRTRARTNPGIEEAINRSSIVVHAEQGSVVLLPYSYLRGAVLESGKLRLLHSLGTIEISGPSVILLQAVQLLSGQMLSSIHDGFGGLHVTVALADDNAASNEL
jgi:hypothetical protein